MKLHNINQNAEGDNNIQIIVGSDSSSIVDICARDIEMMLDNLAPIAADNADAPQIIPPNIESKNVLNMIDKQIAREINRSYAHFDVIRETISSDHTGTLQSKYFQSVYLLQHWYLSKYRGQFPIFTIDIITKYHGIADHSSLAEATKLLHLLNYMYLNCHVGVTE